LLAGIEGNITKLIAYKMMHSSIKQALGYKPEDDEKELLADWKKRTRELCKPCWELHYCPYGPMVEFPLPPILLEEVLKHNEYLSDCLKSGVLGNGLEMNETIRRSFTETLESFDQNNYPDKIPKVLSDAACRVFGHVCPVFFVAEPLTETKERRKHSRIIPRNVMLKVVRRDGQICQECNEPVKDDEVEFDHIIPFSKGGRSTVENLRLIHKGCNRKKSASLNSILHERPIEHLWEIRNKK
jgi:5-methylcytosine-specific restriction endonuclease McrA